MVPANDLKNVGGGYLLHMQSSYTLACVCGGGGTIGRTITILNCAVIFMLKNIFFLFLEKMHLRYWLSLMWETANSFYKLTVSQSQFWREAAGDQGLFILSSSASLPTDTLKHVSSAKSFFSCFQGANDPRTRHCRLFYLTIVIDPPPHHPAPPPIWKTKALSLQHVSAQRCLKEAGNKDMSPKFHFKGFEIETEPRLSSRLIRHLMMSHS